MTEPKILTAPTYQSIEEMTTKEEIIGMMLVLALLEELYEEGHRVVSRRELLTLLGQGDSVSEDDDVMFQLTEKYFQEREVLWATLNAKVADKH